MAKIWGTERIEPDDPLTCNKHSVQRCFDLGLHYFLTQFTYLSNSEVGVYLVPFGCSMDIMRCTFVYKKAPQCSGIMGL